MRCLFSEQDLLDLGGDLFLALHPIEAVELDLFVQFAEQLLIVGLDLLQKLMAVKELCIPAP